MCVMRDWTKRHVYIGKCYTSEPYQQYNLFLKGKMSEVKKGYTKTWQSCSWCFLQPTQMGYCSFVHWKNYREKYFVSRAIFICGQGHGHISNEWTQQSKNQKNRDKVIRQWVVSKTMTKMDFYPTMKNFNVSDIKSFPERLAKCFNSVKDICTMWLFGHTLETAES